MLPDIISQHAVQLSDVLKGGSVQGIEEPLAEGAEVSFHLALAGAIP
jgi:hypothetical protein